MNTRGMRLLLFALVVSLFASSAAYGYSLAEAQALERQKNWNALLTYGKGWAQAEPNNFNARASLAVAYQFLGHPDLALETAKHGLALNPLELGAWTAFGVIYRDLERYSEATDAFRHAVDLAPQNANFWNNLAREGIVHGSGSLTRNYTDQQNKVAAVNAAPQGGNSHTPNPLYIVGHDRSYENWARPQ